MAISAGVAAAIVTPCTAADAGAPKNAFGANRGAFAGYGAPKQPADNSFAAMGADAPTRIARPLVSPQMVNKHKTVDRSAANPFERSGIPAEPAVAAMAASQPHRTAAGVAVTVLRLGVSASPRATAARLQIS